MEAVPKKIAIVTGANRGIGYETALALATRKFKVVMADRADQTASRNRIVEASCNEDITAQHLDLASFESIRSFAGSISRTIDRLDVLVNNAGVFCMNKRKTSDHLDAVMQVNHLGPFLLTNLLADLAKRSLGSRILFVTSSGSFFHNLNLTNFRQPDYFTPHFISGAIHYYNTKLCGMISTKGFAAKLKQWNVSVNCVHPGMANTNFLISSDAKIPRSWQIRVKRKMLKIITRNVDDAAGMLIFLATSDTVKDISGKYFVNYQVHNEPRILEDESFCEAIWNESEKLVGFTETNTRIRNENC